MSSPYETARSQGYSDEQIMGYLGTHPEYSSKIKTAKEQGYSDQEIGSFLSSYKPKKPQETTKEKPERSNLEKVGRIGAQYGLGAAQALAWPAELAVAPYATESGARGARRVDIGDDIEFLLTKKAYASDEWSPQDEELLESLYQQVEHPETIEAQPIDASVRNIAEKATGMDLQPEGIAEKAANWAGFLKDPKKITELFKIGLKPKELIKAIFPSGGEVARGLGAGTAIEMAEEGNFGPIGTMAMAVFGDLAGAGTKGLIKAALSPKQSLAKLTAMFTPKDKLNLQKEIVNDFREAGLQADVGTLTDSNLVKWTQSRLSQSGFTGKALDEFKENLTNQIKQEYKTIAEGLGEAKLANTHEAGSVIKEGVKKIRESDLAATRKLYENANKSLKERAFVNSERLGAAIERLENQLKPGSIKSGEQQIVLDTLGRLKRDLYDSSGKMIQGDVKELMNNKIALNDIINYEVQGGAKQLLKGVVAEIDRAIISHGKDNPTFAKNYINANKKFSEHAKTFRNKDIAKLLNTEDPAQIMNKMNSVQGIRNIEKVLVKSPEGKEILNNAKRLKLDKMIGDNLVDSTTQQVKLGTFSKLLEKGNNKQIAKEILGPAAFKRLERLQKNAAKLADATEKFYNVSKSGVVAADAAVIAKGMGDIASLLMGNPWPLFKTGAGVLVARKLSNLLADPEFLRLTEEAILAASKSESMLILAFMKLRPYIMQAMQQSTTQDQNF